jgi:tetratricopeptide (TPR) repeat protein
MRTRASLIIVLIVFLILIILTLGLLWFQTSTCVTTTNASPTATVTTVVSPSPTVTPTVSDNLTSCVDKANKTVISPLQSLSTLFATLFIISLAILLGIRIWKLSLKSLLVIDAFINASGKDDLDKVLPGLNQLTRERLTQVLEEERLLWNMQRLSQNPFSKIPVPIQASDQPLAKIISSLKDVTTGEMNTAIQLMTIVFTQRGTKVSITLQSRSDIPTIPGLSLEVLDLEGIKEPALHTIWELPIVPPPVAEPFPLPPPSPTEQAQKAFACYRLGLLYEERGALEEAKAAYENALAKLPDYNDATNALARVLEDRKTFEDRYFELIEPAAHWLAGQIALRVQEDDEQSISYQARRLFYDVREYLDETTPSDEPIPTE